MTAGTDAQAEVTVRLEEDGKTVNGTGADADTLVASARAYINALNRLFTKRLKTAPEGPAAEAASGAVKISAAAPKTVAKGTVSA